jgi:hypothetical protein
MTHSTNMARRGKDKKRRKHNWGASYDRKPKMKKEKKNYY